MKTLLGLLIVLLSVNVMAQELPVKFSGDAYVRAFMQDQLKGPDAKGWAQLIRIGADFKAEEGVLVKTRTVLSGTQWEGDKHAGGVTGNNISPGSGYSQEAVRLDIGYIEVPKNGYTFRAGRQSADWGDCFNTCDDRRDRLMIMKPFSGIHTALVYDKRGEGSLVTTNDDTDMFGAVALGKIGDFDGGMLLGYWMNTGNGGLREVKNISPTLKGKLGTLEFSTVYNYLGQGGNNSSYPDSHHSGFLRLGHDIGPVKAEVQGVVIVNGGLVFGGFDTFSSVINNSQLHNQSNIRQKLLTGLGKLAGDKKDDSEMFMGRVSYNLLPELKGIIGFGTVSAWNNTLRKDVNDLVYDAQLHYTLSPKTTVATKYGLIDGDSHLDGASMTLNVLF